MPELRKYRVTAAARGAGTELVWSTRADWEEGELTGAVGFVPVDRLRAAD